jgi:hypothetical protein
MKCVLLHKFTRKFTMIWFFLHSWLPWLINWRQCDEVAFNESRRPLEKVEQLIWNSL